MIHSQNDHYMVLPTATCATNATLAASWDCKGFDHMQVQVICGTHATNGARLTTLKLTESDTVTSASSQSAIVAYTGGTATSTSVGFVIPAPSATTTANISGGGQILFDVDLKRRKRYMGLSITPGSTTFYITGIVRMDRQEVAGISTTDRKVINLAATNSHGIVKIVQG